ncbi:MAG: hypothetical protein NTW08_05555 [Gammaproteobacteria bacterium]|nr:hypothetical protein [Gammaproteobacteria bacterium]
MSDRSNRMLHLPNFMPRHPNFMLRHPNFMLRHPNFMLRHPERSEGSPAVWWRSLAALGMTWRTLGMTCGMLAMLPGCAHHTPPIPLSCPDQCVNRLKACGDACQHNCPACKKKIQAVTDANYQRYVLMRRAQGFVVARQRDAYMDPLACTKVSCDCVADYAVCKQRCSGKVNPVLQNPVCMLDRSIWAW